MRKGTRAVPYFFMTPEIFLFDLDGTLVDSAPDLAGAANHMRLVRDLPVVPYDKLKVTASSGARGLIKAAFDLDPDSPYYDDFVKEFLDYYQDHLADNSNVFPGVKELLKWLEENEIVWGVVTNKHERFTFPLLEALQLKPHVVVCGDTLPERKPSPLPLIYAANKVGKDITKGIYCGDDKRDITAANSAHCFSIAAAWGYLGQTYPIEDWRADLIMRDPSELIGFQIS